MQILFFDIFDLIVSLLNNDSFSFDFLILNLNIFTLVASRKKYFLCTTEWICASESLVFYVHQFSLSFDQIQTHGK